MGHERTRLPTVGPSATASSTTTVVAGNTTPVVYFHKSPSETSFKALCHGESKDGHCTGFTFIVASIRYWAGTFFTYVVVLGKKRDPG